MKKTVYIETLGCEKNTVDAELLIGILEENGYAFTADPSQADVLIVNTCAFIGPAKKEAAEHIHALLDFKAYGKASKVIVAGCMPQRYGKEFEKAFPDIDGFIGVNNLNAILAAIDEGGCHVHALSKAYEEYETGRAHTGATGSAFVRIADGCFSSCSFCAIPRIRGPYKSRALESIVDEVVAYAEFGVREINLIAQETTYYGTDLYDKRMLVPLLEELSRVENISWIRLLYQSPAFLTEEMIDAMFSLPRVLPYFDIPFQHVNKTVLTNMRRWGSENEFLSLIKNIRSRGECAVRTSFIVGFPGEGEDEFRELEEFVEEAQFDRLGIFVYSPEEGTDAISLSLPTVEESEASYRRETLMTRQLDISQARLGRFAGQTIPVLIDTIDDDEIVGRTRFDAPDVDGLVYITPKGDIARYQPGDIVDVRIDHTNDHDLFGALLL